MPHIVHSLCHSTVAHWHADVWGDGGSPDLCKGVPSTRVKYYEAFLSCLPGGQLGGTQLQYGHAPTDLRQAIITAAGGHSSSTIYSLFGVKAKASLATYWENSPLGPEVRRDILAWLADEVKVWTYWPYRSGWLAELTGDSHEDPMFYAETLVLVLAEWAVNNKPLARALGGEPPVAAVEDLVLLTDGESGFESARATLAKTLEFALNPADNPPTAVLEWTRGDLVRMGLRRPDTFDELASQLASSLAAIRYLLPSLDEEQRLGLRDEFSCRLTATATMLEGKHGC